MPGSCSVGLRAPVAGQERWNCSHLEAHRLTLNCLRAVIPIYRGCAIVVRMVYSRGMRFGLLLIAVSVAVITAVLMRIVERRRTLFSSAASAQSNSQSLPSLPRAFAAKMPARIVWAWEEPEDLRSLPATVGIAYLAETLLLGERLHVVPRRQPLRVAANAPMMAVVRIEAASGFMDSPELRMEVERQLAQVALRPGVRTLQIDFDAAASQLPFYRAVLQALRPSMPSGEPLSVTALASWCGEQSWLHGLPLDEAVPMLFRMGGSRAMIAATRGRYPLRENLCRGSRGISTDEPWPEVLRTMDPEARLYLFAPRPWQPAELRAVAATPLSMLSETLEEPNGVLLKKEAAQ